MVLHVEDHSDSSSCHICGGRRPCYALVAGSTGAHGPDYAVYCGGSAVCVWLVFLGAVYTGTRPRVPPSIRAGKGWWGRRELAPRCSATQLGACSMRSYRQRHVRYTIVRTTTTTTTHTHPTPHTHPTHTHHRHHHHLRSHFGSSHFGSRLTSCPGVQASCTWHQRLMELDGGVGGGTGSARRRMRMHWRQEQLSLRMALAAASHHSFDRVHSEHAAARSQTTGTMAGGGEVFELRVAPRGQNTPHSGKRPEPLEEVSEPQGPPELQGGAMCAEGMVGGATSQFLFLDFFRKRVILLG